MPVSPFSLNIKGKLIEFRQPAVMGILNVTPDSFYEESRASTYDSIRRRVAKMVEDGADIIDIGAFSTRPGCDEISEEEELERLAFGMEALRAETPESVVSVDTFRANVAETAITELGANIINDISGARFDKKMMDTVVRLRVPYILTHSIGSTISEAHQKYEYGNFLTTVITAIAKKVSELQLMGVNDLIIDPGFGFGKSLEENYLLLNNLEVFGVFHLPILVGLSRKSMITRLLDIHPKEALTGTTVLNTVALQGGASILRVHDVREAKETIKIFEHIQSINEPC